MTATDQLNPELLIEQTFSNLIGAMELCSIYLGDRIGYYHALLDRGPSTAGEVANATGASARYTREWLEQQAVAGYIACDTTEPNDDARSYWLPDTFANLFCDAESMSNIVSMAQIFVGVLRPIHQLEEAYRTGQGVPFAEYGDVMHEAQAAFNRPQFHHLLATEWLATMPDIVEMLQSNDGARIADIGMGQGWSSIALARGFPNVFVDGFDLDDASVKSANQHAIEAGLSERVVFHARNAGDPDLAGRYDFALAIECIHDMSDPVSVLAAMKRLVGPGGTVLIVDEKVAERFAAPGDAVERAMYGFSVLHCLPVGLADQPSVATGAVIRESTMRQYVGDAGFATCETLPVEHDSFRFYRLTA